MEHSPSNLKIQVLHLDLNKENFHFGFVLQTL